MYTGSDVHTQTYLTRQQWFPAQLAPRALWHLDIEIGNGVRMNSGWGWEMFQHLPLGMAIKVSSESMRMRQKPGEDRKRGKKRSAIIQEVGIFINAPTSIWGEIPHPQSNNAHLATDIK